MGEIPSFLKKKIKLKEKIIKPPESRIALFEKQVSAPNARVTGVSSNGTIPSKMV